MKERWGGAGCQDGWGGRIAHWRRRWTSSCPSPRSAFWLCAAPAARSHERDQLSHVMVILLAPPLTQWYSTGVVAEGVSGEPCLRRTASIHASASSWQSALYLSWRSDSNRISKVCTALAYQPV